MAPDTFRSSSTVLHSGGIIHNEGDTRMKRNGSAVRSALLVGLMLAFAGPALAQQQPDAGLGSAWPTDTPDVSSMPGYHVYTWVKSGVKYVQVNDNSGKVLVALANAGDVFLPLPMGSAAQDLRTPQDASVSTSPGATVYEDDTMKMTATPQTSGAVMFQAVSTCTNPVECSTHFSGN